MTLFRCPSKQASLLFASTCDGQRSYLRQISLPSPAHFVIFSPFLAVSQYFVVPLHKNNNKLQENGKDYIDGRPSYR